MEENKKILLIEDDHRIAQIIAKGLSKKGFNIQTAFDGKVGSRMAVSLNIDLVILDINLPYMNGFEVCREIRNQKLSLPILMLTAMGEVEDKVEALERGADDYLVKPFDFRELIARINALLRRANQTPVKQKNQVLSFADLEMYIDQKVVFRAGKEIELTAREFALLEFLMLNKGRVMSKLDIAEHVWDLNFDSRTNIIEVYINYLRKKVDKDFSTKLIHTKTGLGYVLKEE